MDRNKNRWKKLYNREWNKLVKELGLKKVSMFPNMKKLSQKLKTSPPIIIDVEVGKWEWSGPIM